MARSYRVVLGRNMHTERANESLNLGMNRKRLK